jgi:hypothetical protein
MKKLGVILIMIVVFLPLVSYGSTLSALGTATIDGVISPGEWDNAAKIDFLVNVPPSYGGGTAPATFYVMNDGTNIYLAIKFVQSSYGKSTQFSADFDNNNNGIADDGEDIIATRITPPSSPSFADFYRFASANPPFVEDTVAPDPNGGIPPAGTEDGAGAASNNGTLTVIEMSHPLKSGDTHDISLNPGSTVGLRVTLRLLAPIPGPPGMAGLSVPTDTTLPAAGSGSNYELVKIASQVIQAKIDIKPGSRVNSINRDSEGKIPVAIVSTSDFNAPALVDRSSLTFGRTGDERSLAFCNAGSEDVNGDGIPDLVCHFTTKLAEFQPGDDSGVLKGHTTDGTIFTAKDSVRIVH